MREAKKNDEDRRRESEKHYLEAKALVKKIIELVWFYHKQALSGSNSELIQKTMKKSLEELLDHSVKASKVLSTNQNKAKQLEGKAGDLLCNLQKNTKPAYLLKYTTTTTTITTV